MKPSQLFGRTVQRQRILARFTVERVAKLSRIGSERIKDIERGAIMPRRREWDKLVAAIPGLQLEALRKQAALT